MRAFLKLLYDYIYIWLYLSPLFQSICYDIHIHLKFAFFPYLGHVPYQSITLSQLTTSRHLGWLSFCYYSQSCIKTLLIDCCACARTSVPHMSGGGISTPKCTCMPYFNIHSAKQELTHMCAHTHTHTMGYAPDILILKFRMHCLKVTQCLK